ncbi:hypothetical protein DUNSADRAFT_122 [Dunaliella salina]|uniref:Encoded protein n=1 Tax=Dunaliella salina TaxID=3046 RepID=A0ABQ7GYK7_DUNSA|nr:hypothetical protein DUNSADRAFT_122 [Dunaliella salina]|eukprot:KAF5839693.1 hypothetical protein DUNSADRAFT_122 [Dunaliella salina]
MIHCRPGIWSTHHCQHCCTDKQHQRFFNLGPEHITTQRLRYLHSTIWRRCVCSSLRVKKRSRNDAA